MGRIVIDDGRPSPLVELNVRRALRRGLPILVGEAPGHDGDPDRPLTGRCGKRLAELAGLAWPDEYLVRFGRINLADRWPGKDGERGSRFDREAARPRAEWLLREVAIAGAASKLVLLGRRVARAFGLPLGPMPDNYFIRVLLPGAVRRSISLILFPHPSGASGYWNSPERIDEAATFLRTSLWGTGWKATRNPPRSRPPSTPRATS